MPPKVKPIKEDSKNGSFQYSRQNLSGKAWWLERAFEVLPATLSWSLLISLFLLCFFAPIAGMIVVILFDLYLLFRLLYSTIFLVLSYGLLEVERRTQWHERLMDLVDLDQAIFRTKGKLRELREPRFPGFFLGPLLDRTKSVYSEQNHLAVLERVKNEKIQFPNPKQLFHLVILPFYSEGLTVLEPSIQALTKVNYPLDRMIVVLGVEERAGKEARKIAEFLKREYGHYFFHFEICVHPEGIPGEGAVKGANATYAAKWAKTFLEARRISFERVIVSCFDCDTVVSPEYFSCLSYNYLIHPKRTRTSFQPIPVYHNNLWEAPSFACVVETGSSFMQLIEVTDPERLVTFSSHSMSFQALVEIGYWPTNLVSDDSAIFWKAYLAYDGDYRVEPFYVTVSMDVALGKNLWETCASIYYQKRRWAWGVENFPIVVRGLFANPKISFWKKLMHAFRLLEVNVSWATWTPIMLILTWAPALVATREFSSSVAHFNSPRVGAVICNLALASLVISTVLSLLLLPKSAKKLGFFKKLVFAFQFLLVPVIATVFGAIPALDAQTRLALGKYMEFFVTPKVRTAKDFEKKGFPQLKTSLRAA